MSVGAADRYVTLGVAEAHSSLISAQSSYCSPGNLTLCLEITGKSDSEEHGVFNLW